MAAHEKASSTMGTRLLRRVTSSLAGRCALGALGTLAAVGLRAALSPLVGDSSPYVFFFPVVLAAALLLGVFPGLFSAATAGLVTELWVEGGVDEHPVLGALARPVALLASAGLAAWLAHRVRRSSQEREAEARNLQKEAAASARDARERANELAAVLDAVPAAVFVTHDPSAARISGNRFCSEMLRMPGSMNVSMSAPAGERPQGFAFLQDGKKVPAEDLPVQQAARGREVRGCELELAYVDGTSRWLLGNATPLRDASGAVVGSVGAFTDVTELKQIQERLRETDRRKDEFLAVLSHELRNPLMPIGHALYLLKRACGDQPGVARPLTVLERQTAHLARLVDDLLDVTRIARGKIRLRLERCDLGDVARRVLDDFRASFEARRMRLEAVLPAEPLWAEGDCTRLTQVLGNLLSNALKFTPEGGRVTVRLGREADQAVLTVTDEGRGISPQMMERLFEPFSQEAQGMARTQGGLGLGLALVRGLAQMHGGSASAHSEGVGKGATFTVRLPAEAQQATPAPPGPPRDDQAAGRASADSAQRRRVLIIEDNADCADTLREALASLGHEVEVAYDGLEGVQRAVQSKPDVVLCDIGLPGLDGYEVARRIRAQRQLGATRLVAVSGYAQPEDVERAHSAGFARHLAKPVSLEAVEQALVT